MRDRRYEFAFIVLEFHDPQHEWALGAEAVHLEPILDFFNQDDGCERAKRFAVLDAGVEFFLGVRLAWIAKNTALPECTRPQLRCTCKPGNDPAIDEQVSRDADGFVCLL